MGEVSLVHQQGSLVNYTTLEQTDCASVNSFTFKNILSQFLLIHMTFQLNLLRESPLFWGWNENDLRVLYSVFHT